MELPTNEPLPSVTEIVLGLAYSTGFSSILLSPILGLTLALTEGRDAVFDWTWTVIFGTVTFAASLVLGFVFYFGARSVEWCLHGRFPNFFWNCRDDNLT